MKVENAIRLDNISGKETVVYKVDETDELYDRQHWEKQSDPECRFRWTKVQGQAAVSAGVGVNSSGWEGRK